ncbi:Hypothetical protein D9617_40g013110 [Elsinoe fawcettii]|nr:Hypothetical protein D9617_40g013110 [Elsinoe fawcettii]
MSSKQAPGPERNHLRKRIARKPAQQTRKPAQQTRNQVPNRIIAYRNAISYCFSLGKDRTRVEMDTALSLVVLGDDYCAVDENTVKQWDQFLDLDELVSRLVGNLAYALLVYVYTKLNSERSPMSTDSCMREMCMVKFLTASVRRETFFTEKENGPAPCTSATATVDDPIAIKDVASATPAALITLAIAPTADPTAVENELSTKEASRRDEQLGSQNTWDLLISGGALLITLPKKLMRFTVRGIHHGGSKGQEGADSRRPINPFKPLLLLQLQSLRPQL